MEFEEIWNAHHLPLKNFVTTKVPEREVSDILQIVSIEFYKSIQKGKEIRNSKNWLFQVTRNIIADYFKKKSKSIDSELGFANMPQEDYQDCVCDIVEQVIQSLLPEKYSIPLILSDIYKIPHKEIAIQLDMNYENTKSRIRRARERLKDKVGQSIDLEYNKKGEIVSGRLKQNNNFPPEMVQMIRKLQLED